MTAVAVRPATVDDLDGVVQTFLACWRDSYANLLPPDIRDLYTVDSSTELWRRAPLAEMVVAVVVGRGVLGVARFGADPVDPLRGHVFSLYVHPDSQGLGLGRALLAAAVERFLGAGYTEATLWVFADNAPARAFYTRQGWAPDGGTRTEPAYRLPELRLRRVLARRLRMPETLAER
jgi:ribosomal protein S18 acetylase RimI-like enzyme